MAHPTDALHFREVFGRHMRRPEAGTEQAFFVAPYHQDWKTGEFEDMIEAVRIQVSDCVDHGETFYVSREITEILLRHAEQLRQRRVMHFEADDFPALAGTVYFDGPVLLPTILNESGTQPLVAVIWGQMATRGMDVQMPNDPTRVIGKIMYSVTETTDLQRRTSRHPFRWRLRHWMPVAYDERMDPQNMRINEPPDDEMMAELGDMRLAMSPEERAQDYGDSQASTSIVMCLMKVWCAFLKTEILGRTNWDVDRAHKKMMGREGRPLPQVRIITLRRYAKTSNEVLGNIVNWSHRWKVRGHYRMQRVGPGRAMFQRVWVSECVKGPPHLPLDERDTVQAVTR
jgi:hypothetical protein